MGHIDLPWTTLPEIDRWEILTLNLISMLTQVMSNLLPWFRVVLESLPNNL